MRNTSITYLTDAISGLIGQDALTDDRRLQIAHVYATLAMVDALAARDRRNRVFSYTDNAGKQGRILLRHIRHVSFSDKATEIVIYDDLIQRKIELVNAEAERFNAWLDYWE
jgi:hypothetical protein